MGSAGKLQCSGCVCFCLTMERDLQVKAWVMHSAGTEQLKWVVLGYQPGLRQLWSLISAWLMLLSPEPAAHPLAPSSGQERGNWMFSVCMTEANVYWQGCSETCQSSSLLRAGDKQLLLTVKLLFVMQSLLKCCMLWLPHFVALELRRLE